MPTLPRCAASFLALALAGVLDARADLLVLYPGTQSAGIVGRFDVATGAALAPFGRDNEGMLALCVDAAGNSYVSADLVGSGLIYRFDRAGEFLGKLADVAGADFTALTIGPDGLLYAVASIADPTDAAVCHAHVVRFLRDATAATIFVNEGAAGMNDPRALAFGPDGNLYVADAAAGVLRFDGASGASLGTFVPAGSGGLQVAAALAFADDGKLYVANAAGGSVLRFDATTGAFADTFATGIGAPRGLAFGADGNLYVSSTVANQVLRFDVRTGAQLGAFGGDPSLRGPTTLAFLPGRERPEPRGPWREL